MDHDQQNRLEQRVARAAEAALADGKFVSPIDVLVMIGWLSPSLVGQWRQGRLPYLEQAMSVNPNKLSTAMRLLRSWAVGRGLQPSETSYLAHARDHRRLRFSASGDEAIENAYGTHWVSGAVRQATRSAEPATGPGGYPGP